MAKSVMQLYLGCPSLHYICLIALVQSEAIFNYSSAAATILVPDEE